MDIMRLFNINLFDPCASWSQSHFNLIVIALSTLSASEIYNILWFLFFPLALLVLWKLRQSRNRKYKMYESSIAALGHELKELKISQQFEETKRKIFYGIHMELKNHLSVLDTSLDALIKDNDKSEQKNQLTVLNGNVKQAFELVKQILDFKKPESNYLKLNAKKGDIIGFIGETVSEFKDTAQQRTITLLFESECKSLIIKFDEEKLKKIIFNLLYDAFISTSDGGNISVLISVLEKNESRPVSLLEVKIGNVGQSFSGKNLKQQFSASNPEVFEEIFGNPEVGQCLPMTAEFIKMHGWDMLIETGTDQRCCFIITLEISKQEGITAVIGEQPIDAPYEKDISYKKKPVILLVEDNLELCSYLKENMESNYTVLEAHNGKEGWHGTLTAHPSLVISDVCMPEMNGIDLCHKIKNDNRTNHIPVILLTAMTEESSQLSGLKSGANDYITKPFNFPILQSKINNILHQQQVFKKNHQKQTNNNISEAQVESEEGEFAKRIINLIEANLNNPNFSVEALGNLVAMSRVSLYKKVFTETGQTPVELIRSIRLKKAAQLLLKSKLNISTIAYEVGFNNLSYFSKVFKEEFGILPSEYQSENGKKALNKQ